MMRSQFQRASVDFQPSVRQRSRPGKNSFRVLGAVKRASYKNVVCSKTLIAKKAYIKKLQRECKSMSEFAQKEMSNRENGILSFEVFQDPFEENQIHFMERYLDNTKMGEFNSSTRFTKFMKDVQTYLEEPVGLALYEWRDGQLGASSMQGGPKGEGGLDDATGASGMAAGAGLRQTSAAVNLGDMKRDEETKGWGMGFKFPWDKE
ncbi:hypothetical protein BSKO_03988 [Bryopsis sp. KO-2023]|nr:hypothetical protein BSKO_03988 [Bryopsis sp. KO-2023]